MRAGEPTSACAIAGAVRGGGVPAVDIARAALSRIRGRDTTLNCFTSVTETRALAEADAVDAAVAAGRDPGPLAGVPYAVKNLFDVAGLATVAGSRIDRDRAPAARDAALVRRLAAAGAVLVGATNMDEYAMGYTTENAHYGATRNPHDVARMAGGSSGGSSAAVAAGMVPLALGTDTGGSIGVPASLCGVYGLKPTYGRLSRSGVRLLASSFDHVGPFARSTADLAAVYDALQGHDREDDVSAPRAAQPVTAELGRGVDGMRVGVWNGAPETTATADAHESLARVASAFAHVVPVVVPEAARARAAAAVITGSEASSFHLDNLRGRPQDFDPLTRDRLRAAAMMPATWTVQAHRFRRWFRARMLELFDSVDLVISPATPFCAPPIGEATTEVAGREVRTRRHIGAFAQPISFLGFPALTVPVARDGRLPIGVALVAPPWRETWAFRAAAFLEAAHVLDCPSPTTPLPSVKATP